MDVHALVLARSTHSSEADILRLPAALIFAAVTKAVSPLSLLLLLHQLLLPQLDEYVAICLPPASSPPTIGRSRVTHLLMMTYVYMGGPRAQVAGTHPRSALPLLHAA